MKFSGEFCSDIESISTILSAAWYRTDISSQIFRFLGDFLGMVGALKSDGLDFESLWLQVLDVLVTAQELTFFTTFYNFFFKMIDTYDWISGRQPIFTIHKINPFSFQFLIFMEMKLGFILPSFITSRTVPYMQHIY